MVADAGAAAVAVHGRTAAQSYSGISDWDLISEVAAGVGIPVFGSGDCVEPEQVIERLATHAVSGVLVGRGVLRNPWILAQARDLAEGRPARAVSARERGQFLLDYIDLLLYERVDEAEGFRHTAPCASHGGRRDAHRARARAVGDQQAARARLVVHEGVRERLAPARRDQPMRVAGGPARDDLRVFLRGPDGLRGLRSRARDRRIGPARPRQAPRVRPRTRDQSLAGRRDEHLEGASSTSPSTRRSSGSTGDRSIAVSISRPLPIAIAATTTISSCGT